MNLITRIVSIEIVWGQCEESYFLWRHFGEISPDIVRCFYGEIMVNQITRQSPYQFYRKISIKKYHSPHCLHLQNFYISCRRDIFPVKKRTYMRITYRASNWENCISKYFAYIF